MSKTKQKLIQFFIDYPYVAPSRIGREALAAPDPAFVDRILFGKRQVREDTGQRVDNWIAAFKAKAAKGQGYNGAVHQYFYEVSKMPQPLRAAARAKFFASRRRTPPSPKVLKFIGDEYESALQ